MSEQNALSERADLALAQYLEPLVKRRRVLVLAEPGAPLVGHLEDLDAEVELLTPEELVEEGLPFEDGAFELALARDVSSLAPGPATLVAELRRVVDEEGAIVLASPAGRARRRRRRRQGPPATLERLLSPSCRHVCVLTQTEFAGYALSEVGDEADELAIDRSLGRAAPPVRYVAVGSDRRIPLEPQILVQVPAASREDREHGELGEALAEARRELERLTALETSLREELEAQRRATQQAQEALEAQRRGRAPSTLRRLLDEAEQDLDEALERVALTREALAERDRALVEARRARVDAERQRDQAQQRLQAAEKEAERAGQGARQAEGEVAALEERLRERGEKIAELEAEVRRREVIARDLIEELRQAREGEPQQPEVEGAAVAALRGRCKGLELRLHEAEAALAARPAASGDAERLAQLEQALAEADRAAEQQAVDRQRVAQLEGELAELREALQRAEDALREQQTELERLRSAADAGDVEAQARLELAQRQAREALAERDEARRGLEEARSVLAQLAEKLGVDANDPAQLVASVPADAAAGSAVALAEARQQLSSMARQLEERDARIAQLERQAASEHARKLSEQLGDREAELVLTQNRLNAAERQAEVFRQLCLGARDALSAVVGGRRPEDADSLLERLNDLA